jgi:hypothetical protein
MNLPPMMRRRTRTARPETPPGDRRRCPLPGGKGLGRDLRGEREDGW